MMAIDSKQIDAGQAVDFSRCYEASDRTIAKNQCKQRMLHAAAARMPSDSPWFALRVMPGRELAVEKELSFAGVEVLVPMRMGPVLRRRHRVIPASALPVIMGYVLVRCTNSFDALDGLLKIDGVVSMVGSNDNPHKISFREINSFKDKANAGHFDWERPAGLFKIGGKVKVKDGMFAAFEGKIITCRNDKKGDAVVELMMFGRLVPVLVPIAMLEPL